MFGTRPWIAVFFVFLISWWGIADGFSSVCSSVQPKRTQHEDYCTALFASSPPNNKKRRRRKQQQQQADEDPNELPDFELREEGDEEEMEVTKGRSQQTGGTTMGDPLGEITPSMMASSVSGPNKSIKDLLNDRSIEEKIDFDDPKEGAELPDLLALARQQKQSFQEPAVAAGEGKKKARRAARIAAAEAAKASAEAEKSFLTKIPFIVDEKGDVSPLKILENGTWFGIGALVLWEVYINSPLFDRAEPIIPVIFDMII